MLKNLCLIPIDLHRDKYDCDFSEFAISIFNFIDKAEDWD